MKILLALLISSAWGMDQKLGVVTTTNIADSSVTTSKLAQDAVTATAILTGSVTTSKLGAGAVTTSKIANDAIYPVSLGSANGAFGVFGSTLTALPTGIVSAPGQPYVIAAEGAGDVFANLTEQQMFFTAPAAGNDTLSMWGGTSSSGTFTIPTNGGGFYFLKCQSFFQNIGTYAVTIKKNGALLNASYDYLGSANYYMPQTNGVYKLAAGDVLTCWINQGSGATRSPSGVGLDSAYFNAVKVW